MNRTDITTKIETIENQIKTIEAKMARASDNWDLIDQAQFKQEELMYWTEMLVEFDKQAEPAPAKNTATVSTFGDSTRVVVNNHNGSFITDFLASPTATLDEITEEIAERGINVIDLRDIRTTEQVEESATPDDSPAQRRYRSKAEKALREAGAPHADATPLARWAQDWHDHVQADPDYPVDGVLVGEDGTLLGETRNADGTYRYTPATQERYGLTVTDIGHKRAIMEQAGQKFVLIKSWQVAPGRPLKPETLRLLEDATGRKAEADMLITELLTQGRREGITVAKLAESAGMTRQGVYKRLGEA